MYNDRTMTPAGNGANTQVPSIVLNELWEELLEKEGTRWGMVISDSMRPMITRGEWVLVERVPLEKIRFGDIIVYKSNGMLITHRVLGKRRQKDRYYFLEKGDALLQTSLVPGDRIIGKVNAVKRQARPSRTISFAGRALQIMLGCISYISLRVWVVLEYFLTLGRRFSLGYGFKEAYNKCFTLQRKILVGILK